MQPALARQAVNELGQVGERRCVFLERNAGNRVGDPEDLDRAPEHLAHPHPAFLHRNDDVGSQRGEPPHRRRVAGEPCQCHGLVTDPIGRDHVREPAEPLGDPLVERDDLDPPRIGDLLDHAVRTERDLRERAGVDEHAVHRLVAETRIVEHQARPVRRRERQLGEHVLGRRGRGDADVAQRAEQAADLAGMVHARCEVLREPVRVFVDHRAALAGRDRRAQLGAGLAGNHGRPLSLSHDARGPSDAVIGSWSGACVQLALSLGNEA